MRLKIQEEMHHQQEKTFDGNFEKKRTGPQQNV